MCGINLIISKIQADLGPVLQRMAKETAFRGPDAEGKVFREWGAGNLALGANRLRIVDRDENSDQPMASQCGNYLLAFNGEVYNYQNLKSKLIGMGQEFRTHSDTEVVLYWLMKNGPSGLNQLQGMYAIAFVNIRQGNVLIARDSIGIKPLFVYRDEEKLIASSSIKAITASGLVEKKLNRSAVADYLSFRHVMGRKSFFEGITSVEPGTAVEIHKQGSSVLHYISTDESNETNLKDALIDSVTLLTSNQTPALLLSGGVDSTLLLAIYRHELGNYGMPTYTLNTGEDAKWSAIAAKQFDADHNLIDVEAADVERALGMLEIMDQPIADHGALATWLISEKIKHNHHVVLSGAGADELFGGYNRHRAFNSYLRNRMSWLNFKKYASKLNYRGLPNQLKTFFKSIDSSKETTFYKFLRIHGIDNKGQVNPTSNSIITPDIGLDRALDFDLKNFLVNDVLAITDLATMSHGIESRVPYLFDNVVQSACEIPSDEKLRDKGKWPLKKILQDYNGKAFSRRAKIGFGLPMNKWLAENDSPLWSMLDKSDPVFEHVREEQFNLMKKDHMAGRKDWNMQLWSILVLSHWLKRNFN